MEVTLSGIYIDVVYLQEINAKMPIEVTLLGMVILDKNAQFWNA
jgi:hypothetical protein